jgi:hypothetical protein
MFAMTLQLDLSDLRSALSDFTLEQMLAAAVLVLAFTVLLLVWKAKK